MVWVECVCVSCVYSMGCVCALCAWPLCVHEVWGSEPCKSVEACGVTLGGGSFWGKPGGQQSVTALSPVMWAPQSASGHVVALACSMATPVGMLLEHVTVRPEGGRGLARVGGLPCVSLAVRGSENAPRRALESLS